ALDQVERAAVIAAGAAAADAIHAVGLAEIDRGRAGGANRQKQPERRGGGEQQLGERRRRDEPARQVGGGGERRPRRSLGGERRGGDERQEREALHRARPNSACTGSVTSSPNCTGWNCR